MKINNINPSSNVLNEVADNILNEKKTEEFKNILDEAKGKQDDKELKEACKQFESYFINQIYKEMRSTIQHSDFIKQGQGEKIFTEMQDEHMAKEATESGGIGLANMLYKQLSKTSL